MVMVFIHSYAAALVNHSHTDKYSEVVLVFASLIYCFSTLCTRQTHIHTQGKSDSSNEDTKKLLWNADLHKILDVCVCRDKCTLFLCRNRYFFCLNNLYLFTWKFMECRQTNGRFFRTVIILYHFFVLSTLVVVLIV